MPLFSITTSARSALVFLFDLSAVAMAWVGGFLLRFNFSWPPEYNQKIVLGLVVLLVVQTAASRWAGLYRGMWSFASLPDLKRVLKAVALSAGGLVCLLAIDRSSGPAIPRSMLVLYPILLMMIMGGGRAAWRMWKEHRIYGGLIATGKPVVIVGAGTAAAMLIRELERTPDWRVVALVDDSPTKLGLELHGHPVAGTLAALPDVLRKYKAQHVILAIPSAPPEELRRATNLAISGGAQVFTVPRLEDLMTGRVAITKMQPVAIEDLLGRETVSIDTAHVLEMIAGKTVLVTGAGGSIGSELCRQLGRFAPHKLVLYEISEFALYSLEQWFALHSPSTCIVPLAGDVRDAVRLDEVFAEHRPQIVFHAAAYKHVPLMEVGNAWQAVRNNVLGTLQVAQCAQAYSAERFILISTDKAVNPTNVMGATKRLAEMVCEALYRRSSATQFEIVRFGNVLGSNGSVIPKFQEQIARGGPVTVTHPEITRYFMSIPEAAQLVLQASAMGKGGEIFVLDMGEPVRIAEMARNMIRLCGYSEDEIRIEFTGLRPGEKLYEELLADNETTCETPHPKLRIAKSREVESHLLATLANLFCGTPSMADAEVRTALRNFVPEYQPTDHGRSAKSA